MPVNNDLEEGEEDNVNLPRRSGRTRHMPKRFGDYVLY